MPCRLAEKLEYLQMAPLALDEHPFRTVALKAVEEQQPAFTFPLTTKGCLNRCQLDHTGRRGADPRLAVLETTAQKPLGTPEGGSWRGRGRTSISRFRAERLAIGQDPPLVGPAPRCGPCIQPTAKAQAPGGLGKGLGGQTSRLPTVPVSTRDLRLEKTGALGPTAWTS